MKRIALALCALCMMLAACSVMNVPAESTEMPLQQPIAQDSEAGAATPRTDDGKLTEAQLEPAELRIQREGRVRVDAKDPQGGATKLRRLAPEFDAVLMNFKTRSVTFKMPSAKLESLLQKVENLEGCEIEELDFSAFDRSGEYYGLQPRYEAKTKVRARLLTLIESAPTAAELSNLQHQLEQVQSELDKMETQLRDIALKAGRVDVTITFE